MPHHERSFRTSIIAVTVALLAVGLAGCDVAAPPAPSASPTSTPVDLPAAPAVVTFDVADQGTYSIELVRDDLIEHVAELMAGGEDGRIPSGRIVRDGDGGVNAPWSWHIDPDSLEFVDFTTEVCDGLPSYVEDLTLTSDIYCPWNATVTGLRAKG